MLLALDIGNSRIKWGVYDALTPRGRGYFPTQPFRPSDQDQSVFELNSGGEESTSEVLAAHTSSVKELMHLMGSVTHLSLCSVAGSSVEQALLSHLYSLGMNPALPIARVLASQEACGVMNHYDYPEQLGADRWAALIAARAWSNSPLVVVMAGTATTVDALKVEGHFLGGTILPGIRLMPKSLYERTAHIKEGDGSWAEFPRNTADAVASGVLSATAGAIAGMIHNLQHIQNQPVKLLVSGGNSPLLIPRLTALGLSPHYEHDLVLQGIALMSLRSTS
jgi:type III pantothenate kinase